jgi:hypothetical protein
VTISDSTGGAQVVWHERNGQTDSIWYAKLSPMGAMVTKQKVSPGEGPVIDYTDYVTGAGTSIYPAFIAGITSSPVDVWYWSGSLWNSIQPNVYATPENILIRSSMGGGWFLVAYSARGGSAFLDAIVCGSTGLPQSGTTQTGDSLRGVDIDRDDNGTTTMKHGCIVYCLAPSGTTLLNLYSIHLDPIYPGAVHAPTTLITAAANEGVRYPALCPDTCAINVNQRAGLLLAWDWEYQQSGMQRHKVQTNQLTLSHQSWIFSGSSHITVSDTSSHILYPDIARIRSSAVPGDTAAFVVWESALEVCGSARPVEVACNWVIFDSLSARRGKQWSWPKQASPGSGAYAQLKPMVHTSKDYSVNVFWYDGRGASDLVMGTRLLGDSTDIDWAKEKREHPETPPATIRLGEIYPNPLALSRSSVSTISVEITAETEVSLKIYDNLGRERATVYEGVLTTGLHFLQFNAAGLRPGTFYYMLRAANAIATRGIIILR